MTQKQKQRPSVGDVIYAKSVFSKSSSSHSAPQIVFSTVLYEMFLVIVVCSNLPESNRWSWAIAKSLSGNKECFVFPSELGTFFELIKMEGEKDEKNI